MTVVASAGRLELDQCSHRGRLCGLGGKPLSGPEPQTVTATAPEFQEEEFTYIKEDGRICYAWHQVTAPEAASTRYSLAQALNNTCRYKYCRSYMVFL